MDKATLLIVAHGYPTQTIGGVGQVVQQLLEHLPNLGWDVHLLVPKRTRSRILRPTLVQTSYSWGTLHTVLRYDFRWSTSWMDRQTDSLLCNLLDRIRPRRIHIHHLGGLPLEWLLAHKNSVLHMTLHDYTLPCARGQLLDRNLQVCAGPSSTACATCIEPWTPFERNPESAISTRLRIVSRVLHKADQLDAPSHDLIKRFKAIYPTLHISHCELPIALAPQPPYTSDQPYRSEQKAETIPRCLFVGSLHPSKGLHIALQAFVRLDISATLSIVGSHSPSDVQPQYEHIWKDFATQYPNIKWLGSLPHGELLRLMDKHDVLILPSLWPENSPIVIREALQRGLRVVVGRGGSKELSNSIIQADPLSVHNVCQALQQALKTPQEPPQTFPSPRSTIAHWIGSAKDID